jgi:hypothetical protein
LKRTHVTQRKRSSIALSFYHELERLLGCTAPQEVRVQRVDAAVVIDRCMSCRERLREKLPTVRLRAAIRRWRTSEAIVAGTLERRDAYEHERSEAPSNRRTMSVRLALIVPFFRVRVERSGAERNFQRSTSSVQHRAKHGGM